MLLQPKKSKPLKVALAGAGMISWYHLIAWRKPGRAGAAGRGMRPGREQGPQQARRRVRHSQVYRTRRALFDGEAIDALDVASPRETHAAWVEAAAARGIDVLCQKPLTPTLGRGRGAGASGRRQVRLMVHENWRFRPWYRDLKRWIDAGELGRRRSWRAWR